MSLIINKEYLVTTYCPTIERQAIYIGKVQEESITTNEVHGFLSKNGIYAVTKSELPIRVKASPAKVGSK